MSELNLIKMSLVNAKVRYPKLQHLAVLVAVMNTNLTKHGSSPENISSWLSISQSRLNYQLGLLCSRGLLNASNGQYKLSTKSKKMLEGLNETHLKLIKAFSNKKIKNMPLNAAALLLLGKETFTYYEAAAFLNTSFSETDKALKVLVYMRYIECTAKSSSSGAKYQFIKEIKI